MNDIEELVMLLRDKTALGRLTDIEVHSVLAYLEGIGFAPPTASSDPTMPAPNSLPGPHVVAPPAAHPSALASLEATIEKDVKDFFEPAPVAAPIASPPVA